MCQRGVSLGRFLKTLDHAMDSASVTVAVILRHQRHSFAAQADAQPHPWGQILFTVCRRATGG